MVYINVFLFSGHLFTCLVKMSFVQTLSIDWLLFLALQVVYEMLHEKSNKAPYVKITANKAMSIFMVSPSHDFIHRLNKDSIKVKRC